MFASCQAVLPLTSFCFFSAPRLFAFLACRYFFFLFLIQFVPFLQFVFFFILFYALFSYLLHRVILTMALTCRCLISFGSSPYLISVLEISIKYFLYVLTYVCTSTLVCTRIPVIPLYFLFSHFNSHFLPSSIEFEDHGESAARLCV